VPHGEESADRQPEVAPDARAPGLMLGQDVRVGEGVRFGAHVVVHTGSIIGAGCVIEDHAVLGKRPRLAKGSSAHGDVGRLELREQVSVGAGAVVLAGASVGKEVIIGAQSFVRERSSIGAATLIGRGSVIDNDVSLGARASVQTNVYVTAFSVVEDDVFIGPGAITTNDDSMARHGPHTPLRGPVLRRACRIGASALLRPGVEIGEEAVVAAGALVTRDVPARSVVMGVPARVVREVGSEDLLERWR
jgi:acetyltransferase-like isoleucine patch superfamily enzyme